ncbi:RING-H2 finger protein ATL74-like [Zingiber officinale]|uniref:RING-type domain-containing protein n=1 Tax=Zingiber officinale TaxID=94328 RepID=A0A8J5L987_ZINOF|nr:RING-H2 finger protein ATL74-like [Zingiber officinale]KAG6518956.1 hypothetical protein ZIOFF_022442 [Zingiber officinale]
MVQQPHPRELSVAPTRSSTAAVPAESRGGGGDAALDYDVVVILAAMICALVCALGLNSMLQCVVRCTRRALADPAAWITQRRLNAGLKREDVVALPVDTYAAATSGGSPSSPSASATPQPGCAICLSDFADGDKIRVLPICGHRFHVSCIDTWLLSHCSCPTCRRRLSSSRADDTTAP